jgi:GNAT superfamily N-acetyltransferase
MKTRRKHCDIDFSVVAEQEVVADLDKAIRDILVACFPADRQYFQRQSWWHSAAIYRVLGRDRSGSIVAHAGIVERTINVGRNLSKVRVAGVQSFCVSQDYRGAGLSERMMLRAMTEAEKRGFDAGLLFCIDALKKVYGSMGWQEIDSDVYMLDEREATVPVPSKNVTMFYPLGKSEFPPGDIDLAGADW